MQVEDGATFMADEARLAGDNHLDEAPPHRQRRSHDGREELSRLVYLDDCRMVSHRGEESPVVGRIICVGDRVVRLQPYSFGPCVVCKHQRRAFEESLVVRLERWTEAQPKDLVLVPPADEDRSFELVAVHHGEPRRRCSTRRRTCEADEKGGEYNSCDEDPATRPLRFR